MAQTKRLPHILCYDIADPKRLNQMRRIALHYGRPLQYSVYLVIASEPELQALEKEIRSVIKENEDDVRIYPLQKRIKVDYLGKTVVPEGLWWGEEENQICFQRWPAR